MFIRSLSTYLTTYNWFKLLKQVGVLTSCSGACAARLFSSVISAVLEYPNIFTWLLSSHVVNCYCNAIAIASYAADPLTKILKFCLASPTAEHTPNTKSKFIGPLFLGQSGYKTSTCFWTAVFGVLIWEAHFLILADNSWNTIVVTMGDPNSVEWTHSVFLFVWL